jgi:hypothetical protein
VERSGTSRSKSERILLIKMTRSGSAGERSAKRYYLGASEGKIGV